VYAAINRAVDRLGDARAGQIEQQRSSSDASIQHARLP
jgi:hypothetical protein